MGWSDELKELSLNQHPDYASKTLVTKRNGSLAHLEQAVSVPKVPRIHYVQADNAVPSNILTGITNNQVTFKIGAGLYKKVKALSIKLTVAETGGVNTVPMAPSPYFAQRIEFWSGGSRIWNLFAEVNYFNVCNLFNTEMGTSLYKLYGMSTSTFAGATLAASGVAVMKIPILNDPLSMNRINVKHLEEDIQIRVTFQNSVEASASIGTLVVNKMELEIKDDDEPDSRAEREYHAKIDQGIEYRIWEGVLDSFPGLGLTASNKTTKLLTNMTGNIGLMLFGLRVNPNSSVMSSSQNFRTFTALGTQAAPGSFQLLEGSAPILGGGPIDDFVHRHEDTPITFSLSTFPSVVPFYAYPFGDMKLFQGILDGYLPSDGKHNLEITPGSGFTNGTYQLDVYSYQVKHLHIKNGRITVH